MRHEEVPNPLPSPYFVYWEIDGEIEAVEVLEYDLSSPDCMTKTFLILENGVKARCGIDMFFATPGAALASYQEGSAPIDLVAGEGHPEIQGGDRLDQGVAAVEGGPMPQILITLPDDIGDVKSLADFIEEMLGMAGVVIDSVKHGDDPTGLRKVQEDLLHRMRALHIAIEDFALMPAPDFYKPGDYAAEKARLLWVESVGLLSVPGSWNNVVTKLYDRCRNLRWGWKTPWSSSARSRGRKAVRSTPRSRG